MKILQFTILFLTLLLSTNSWAQKTEEFDVTFEQDITVEGKIEVTSITQGSTPYPVMTEVQRDAITSPTMGQIVYNSNTKQLNVYDGSDWQSAGGGGISNWITAFNYVVGDVVIESNKIYQANTAHTSTTFASQAAFWTSIANDVTVSTGVLPMANGGTDKALTSVIGGVVYTDANSMEVLAAGTAGQELQSNGGAAPTWVNKSIKAKAQGGTQYTAEEIGAPNKQIVTTDTNKPMIETGNKNILFNAGFESNISNGTDGHTAVLPGTSTFSTTNAGILGGTKVGILSCDAFATCSVTQTQAHDSYFGGNPALVSALVYAIDPGVQFCAIVDNNEVGCKDVPYSLNPTDSYKMVSTEVKMGTTNLGYRLKQTVGALTALVRIDDVKAEPFKTDSNTQPAISPWKVYTPVTQGFSSITPSTNFCSCRQNGSQQEIKCKFQASGAAAEARIGFCDNAIATDTFSGNTQAGPVVSFNATNDYFIPIKANGLGYVMFGRAPAAGGALSQVQGSTVMTSATMSFSASAEIPGYAASVNSHNGRCNDPRNCYVGKYEARIGTASAITKQTFPNHPWITSCSKSGSSNFITTCTLNSAMNLTVPMNCTCTSDNSGVGGGCDFSASSAAGTAVFYTSQSNAVANIPITVSCSKQGVDAYNSFIATINGQFGGYNQVKGSTKPGSCSAKISATGGISDHKGGCFASCTNATTPVCTFTSNYWVSGSVPNCWHSNAVENNQATLVTTTTMSGVIVNTAGTPASGARTYFCEGDLQ